MEHYMENLIQYLHQTDTNKLRNLSSQSFININRNDRDILEYIYHKYKTTNLEDIIFDCLINENYVDLNKLLIQYSKLDIDWLYLRIKMIYKVEKHMRQYLYNIVSSKYDKPWNMKGKIVYYRLEKPKGFTIDFFDQSNYEEIKKVFENAFKNDYTVYGEYRGADGISSDNDLYFSSVERQIVDDSYMLMFIIDDRSIENIIDMWEDDVENYDDPDCKIYKKYVDLLKSIQKSDQQTLENDSEISE